MATTDNASQSRSQSQVIVKGFKQVVRDQIDSYLTEHFANSLAKEPNMTNLFMALVQRESSFNSQRGITYESSHLKRILGYSAVKVAYDSSPLQARNIEYTVAAFGLTQVTGYYHIRGCGPKGISEMERMRPDICGPLLISPGDDLSPVMLGNSGTVNNQLLAGLIVLEDKYNSSITRSLVASGKWSNRLTCAIASYLGLGGRDGLGTTPERYARSIMYGDSYARANGSFSVSGVSLVSNSGSTSNNASPAQSSTGPVQTAASGNNLTIVGCG